MVKAWSRQSAAAAFFGGVKRKSKYGNRKTPCSAGHMHDSVKEALRCNELRLLERAGRIQRLEQQPEFPITINGELVCVYRADFAYFKNNARVIEDTKSEATRKDKVYRLKKKLVEASYPGVRIVEV